MLGDRAYRVVRALALEDPSDRSELAERASVSAATLQRALGDLRQERWLDDEDDGDRPQGSPVRLSRRAGLVVGVDVGRRHRRAAVAGLQGNILGDGPYEPRDPIDVENLGGAVAEEIASLVEGALEHASDSDDEPFSISEVRSLAIGVPTPVDRTGRVVGMFLPQWAGLPLRDIVRERLMDRMSPDGALHPDLEIVVAKDADLGALAAWRDYVQAEPEEPRGGQEILLYLKASHGIDAGIVCGGNLVTGSAGMSSQVGHMWVPAEADTALGAFDQALLAGTDQVCSRCTRFGCLESLASGRALLDRLTAMRVPQAPTTLDDLLTQVNTMQTEHQHARQAVLISAIRTGSVLAEAARVIDPTRIAVGGLLALTGEAFMEPLRATKFIGAAPELVVVDDVRGIELRGALELARARLRFTP
jgi:predicted NBD/HSP70 family sugar kinase